MGRTAGRRVSVSMVPSLQRTPRQSVIPAAARSIRARAHCCPSHRSPQDCETRHEKSQYPRHARRSRLLTRRELRSLRQGRFHCLGQGAGLHRSAQAPSLRRGDLAHPARQDQHALPLAQRPMGVLPTWDLWRSEGDAEGDRPASSCSSRANVSAWAFGCAAGIPSTTTVCASAGANGRPTSVAGSVSSTLSLRTVRPPLASRVAKSVATPSALWVVRGGLTPKGLRIRRRRCAYSGKATYPKPCRGCSRKVAGSIAFRFASG